MSAPAKERVHRVSGRDASHEELVRLADLSLAEYLRHLARYGGAIHEEDGLLLFAGTHRQPNPYRNGVLRLDDRLGVDELLARGREFFAERTGSYALWIREHGDAELEAWASREGLHDLGRLPELALTEFPTELPLPDGVELRQARDERTRLDYLGIVAEAWGMGSMPLPTAAQVFFDPDSLDAPNVAAFVAYYDDMPLSGAMTLVTHGVALGCQGATIRRPKPGQRLPPLGPAGRERGLAEHCLWAALRLSFEELGAWCSLGQTSESGAAPWRRIGYRPFSSYARFLVPSARSAASS